MSHIIKVKSVSEGYSQSDNASYINVQVEVLKDDEVVGERSFGYPLATTKEEIEADLKKVANALDVDEEQAVKSAELAEALKNVESAKELIDKEIL